MTDPDVFNYRQIIVLKMQHLLLVLNKSYFYMINCAHSFKGPVSCSVSWKVSEAHRIDMLISEHY